MSTTEYRPVVSLPHGTADRDAAAVKRVRVFLTSLAKHYKLGEVLSVKESLVTSLDRKVGTKITTRFNTTHVKRTSIRERIAQKANEISLLRSSADPKNIQLVQADSNPLTKYRYFTLINCAGATNELCHYLGNKLTKSQNTFHIDSMIIALASLLQSFTANPDFYIGEENVNIPGVMRVLRGFELYAVASTPQEEYDAITYLYNEFVVGVVDRAAKIVADTMQQYIISQIIGAGGNALSAVSSYCSSKDCAQRTMQFNVSYINTYAQNFLNFVESPQQQTFYMAGPGAYNYVKSLNDKKYEDVEPEDDADYFLISLALKAGVRIQIDSREGIPTVTSGPLQRSEWLNNRGVEKVKNPEDYVSLEDIPGYAYHLGLIKSMTALVPPEFRKEVRTEKLISGKKVTEIDVSYPLLGLDPRLAYKLQYVFDMSYNPVDFDTKPTRYVDASGKSRRILNLAQAYQAIAEHVMGYFAVNSENGNCNIISLITREKYIDFTASDMTLGKIGTLSFKTANTAFLFPEAPPPQIVDSQGRLNVTAEQAVNNPALLHSIIIYCIAITTKSSFDVDKIKNSLKSLYSVLKERLSFNENDVDNITFNTIPSEKAAITMSNIGTASVQHRGISVSNNTTTNAPHISNRSSTPLQTQSQFGQAPAAGQQGQFGQQMQRQHTPVQQGQFGQQMQQGPPMQQTQHTPQGGGMI